MNDDNTLVFFIYDYTTSLYSIVRTTKALAFGFYIPKKEKYVLADTTLSHGSSINKRILEKTFENILKGVKEGVYFLDYPRQGGVHDVYTGETNKLTHKPFDPEHKKPAYQICSKECLRTKTPIFIIAQNEKDFISSLFDVNPKRTIDVYNGMTFLACIPVNDPKLVKFFSKYLPILDKIHDLREELNEEIEIAKEAMATLSSLLPLKEIPLLGFEELKEGGGDKQIGREFTNDKVPEWNDEDLEIGKSEKNKKKRPFF